MEMYFGDCNEEQLKNKKNFKINKKVHEQKLFMLLFIYYFVLDDRQKVVKFCEGYEKLLQRKKIVCNAAT